MMRCSSLSTTTGHSTVWIPRTSSCTLFILSTQTLPISPQCQPHSLALSRSRLVNPSSSYSCFGRTVQPSIVAIAATAINTYCSPLSKGHRQHHQHRWYVSPSSTSHGNFYHNRVLEQYAEQQVQRVTLRQLSVFGRNFNLEKVLRSANYIRTELSVRLAHRIVRFQQLPFVVGTNPHIELIYNLYWDAFETFRSMSPITTIEQNREFCETLQTMLNTHLIAIPQLAIGIAESELHMSTRRADNFINETLRSRIGRRVLVEQHIALSQVYDGTRENSPDWIGIVNTKCHARTTVEKCANLAGVLFRQAYGIEPPPIIIDGFDDANFTYIPDHIEYILFELIKNSMRFTAKKHSKNLTLKSKAILPFQTTTQPPEKILSLNDWSTTTDPIDTFEHHHSVDGLDTTSNGSRTQDTPSTLPKPPVDTSVPCTDESFVASSIEAMPQPPTTASHSTLPSIRVTIGQADTNIIFRISDQGGGVSLPAMPQVWSYLNASSKRRYLDFDKMPVLPCAENRGQSPVLPSSALYLGLGLPMSRVYANYWGGNISMYSMDGYGTDVYVNISVGNQSENLFDEMPESR
ncbi:hypothetical protein BASA50_006664 [Batrachochytrium salamandrivorans]|uniref:Protein-serine/threonine kinase n=1 Tax=Batrachochytrium salamandrivorans TaxID=1357716 RepID=A0ABQ8F9B5_9FUNG|nr:hypothetical protein BASA62_000230 [Batrachochytrium salamandrivorans]KAH6578321.1 hypothetical protein BASA61_000313 [Batrachochytrium salamandrivorans]KAH6580319.1 hypothetical protein BASA60_002926 [Batrachochytrium salamandrivorans]KAH6594417.1 hypothetical protein BASA50_006664 [Batrachochytrium salamandrivorans]KAH9252152.1 hypothetical protein BASA81_009903 [Batrachochytrium salamandrivorans]